MKLYARTSSGTGLGLDVLLTGQLNALDGKICGVEIALPAGCGYVYGVPRAALPKAPSGRLLLWVDAGDVCANDGATATQEEIRAEAVRVNDQRRIEMLRGPLGENWP